MRAAVRVAKKMGDELGRRQILLGTLPSNVTSSRSRRQSKQLDSPDGGDGTLKENSDKSGEREGDHLLQTIEAHTNFVVQAGSHQ